MSAGASAERKFDTLTLELQHELNSEVFFRGLPGVLSKAPSLARDLAFLIREYAEHVAKYSVDDDAVRVGLRSLLEQKIWSSEFLSVNQSDTLYDLTPTLDRVMQSIADTAKHFRVWEN